MRDGLFVNIPVCDENSRFDKSTFGLLTYKKASLLISTVNILIDGKVGVFVYVSKRIVRGKLDVFVPVLSMSCQFLTKKGFLLHLHVGFAFHQTSLR